MMSSSQYSPHMPHATRGVSPVYESDEEYCRGEHCGEDADGEEEGGGYSPIHNHHNGEAYLVSDFYHQPMPLHGSVSGGGSDSGPEYSQPWASTLNPLPPHSPNSLRHVFAPASSAFAPPGERDRDRGGGGGKFKPRMGVMATISLNDKPPTVPFSKPPSNGGLGDLRAYHPAGHLDGLDAALGLSHEGLDSPVYDSTQYIVTPTRRRNSEHDKSPSSRSSHTSHTMRRDGPRVEYPELGPGRVDDLSGLVPPGVVLLQPGMFGDGSLDSRIMSEIEMSNLRAALHPSPDLTDNSGDSSTVQDRLLSGNHHGPYHHLHNGHNGHNGLPSPPPYQPHKNGHQLAYNDLALPRPRPVTGSGVVFRRRRKPCWCVLLVVVAVALLATGISLGVLFGVVTKTEEAGRSGVGHRAVNATPTTTLHTSTTPLDEGGWDGEEDEEAEEEEEGDPVTDFLPLPPVGPSPSASPLPPGQGRDGDGGSKPAGGEAGPDMTARHFKAFWHPGDSRVLEVNMRNGTWLRASGHKANNGTFLGLYSLSLTEGQGRTTRVRFLGGRSLASVILPDGTVVSLDWSAHNSDIECKVFQIPPPRGAPGVGPGDRDSAASVPTSHLATLQLGVYSYVLRQISRVLEEASASPGALDDDDEDASRQTPTPFCAPRLPVKVTKCGGQYPYGGAFVQGDVTMATGPTVNVAALPWRRQDDDDDCYDQFRAASPNFFIPLPGHVDPDQARVIASRFWRSGARWLERVCGVVGAVLEPEQERQKVCANMAASAQTQLAHSALYAVVYDSCSALLTSLHLLCRTLDDRVSRALHEMTPTRNASGGNGGNGGAGSGGVPLSQRQELVRRVLAGATSLTEPHTTPSQEIRVKTFAFCPSSQPLSSFDKAITLRAAAGPGPSRDVTAADMVHVNCAGHPEVTYFYLGHAAAVEPLDKVKHRLRVCAVCAFEKTFSVHVQRDLMCCNDTCARQSRCEESSSDARRGAGLSESHTFDLQNSVYCHDFLEAADTPSRPFARSCLGTCQSNLEVRFQVKDAVKDGSEGGRVYLDQMLTCLEGYKETCKSTFGH